MEDYKRRLTLSLLARTDFLEKALVDCGQAISDLVEIGRACYEEEVKYTKTEFAKILFFDGCFILELFMRCHEAKPQHDEHDDPILLNPWMIQTIRRDLALLENQIPFHVLNQLFQVIQNNSSDGIKPNLADLARGFFELDTLNSHGRYVFHLLDLIHSCYCPSSESKHPSHTRTGKLIHSATKLRDAGIEFAEIEHEDDQKKRLFDWDFKNGVIKIPQLCMDSSLFQNLVAMEQYSPSHKHFITSYGLLMDYFIDSSKDVELLVKKRIIPHNFGDYEQVADLFNNICKQTVVKGFYFAELCDQVDEYYTTKCHIYRKSLLRNYCGNPWMIASVITACLLLGGTLLQTVYSVLSYYHS